MPLSILLIEEKLLVYFQQKFPHRKRTQILNVQSLTKGWETELFSFTYSYQENCEMRGEEFVLRIYPGLSAKDNIKKEFTALKALYKAGYPVPKTHFLELDTSFFGHSFIIMDRIIGSDMGEEFFQTLQEGNYEKLQREFIHPMCNLFVQLHNLDWRILQGENDYKDILKEKNLLNKISRLETRVNREQLSELKPIIHWLKSNCKEIKIDLAINHGDFHPHNIMISDKGEAFVIDWSACSIGDYREDLGWTLLLTGAYTTRKIRDMILETYESIKGIEVQKIKFFEVLSAVRRLRDILLLFKYGADTSGMREEAKDQVKQQIAHLNYVLSLVKTTTGIDIQEIENFVQSILRS